MIIRITILLLFLLICAAYYYSKKYMFIIIGAVLFSFLLVQQLSLEHYIRFLANRRIESGLEYKSYIDGARDMMDYACRLRWLVMAESLLLFLMSILGIRSKSGKGNKRSTLSSPMGQTKT